MYGNLSLTSNATGSLSIDASKSNFYTKNVSIPQSASNGAQQVTTTFSAVAPTLGDPRGIFLGRYLINGIIYSDTYSVSSSSPKSIISYVGNNIREDFDATDGTTVVRSDLITGFTLVNLSGLISASPNELFTSNLGIITNSVNGQSLYKLQANWNSGAAYVKVESQSVSDTLYVTDCTLPITKDTNVTPCTTSISTLENFFPFTSTSDGITYQLSDGKIIMLAGARAWLANTPGQNGSNLPRVFFQNNAYIFEGSLVKDGTPRYSAPLGGGALQKFSIYLNNSAIESIKSAVNF